MHNIIHININVQTLREGRTVFHCDKFHFLCAKLSVIMILRLKCIVLKKNKIKLMLVYYLASNHQKLLVFIRIKLVFLNPFVSTVPTFAVRETATLGIMGTPRVPPFNPSESIVLSEHYRL